VRFECDKHPYEQDAYQPDGNQLVAALRKGETLVFYRGSRRREYVFSTATPLGCNFYVELDEIRESADLPHRHKGATAHCSAIAAALFDVV
jgi:hypothetical protein